MNKRKIIVFIAVVCILLCSCGIFEDDVPINEVIASIGEISERIYFQEGGWQDIWRYAEYRFESYDLEHNEYFTRADGESIGELKRYITDYENDIETISVNNPNNAIITNYSLSVGQIDESDYFFIDGNGDTVNYAVYFFDMQTETLYFLYSDH
ncbi:MAG: hypothetical protein E7595_04655 [Ruminococcaceae bacterium]|nr:hypothetical protein [Oscillospiraceae bacterium]